QPDQGGVGGVGGGLSALGCGLVVEDPVGAPPRCERAGTRSHPGRVLLRVGVGFGFVVGAPPRCEWGGHVFAPGAGAPTVRSWVWFCSRSTALGAKGVGTHSHPGRVLLRVGLGIGFVVGAPPSVRMGRARIRTRGGRSYGSVLGL